MDFRTTVFLCAFNLFLVTSGSELVRKIVKKRSDIDLQTCIENFDVHKDKIIRTQDSKDMGAKYINEIDLGSREECLRLCCETENCDVFVFEEKNSGSCYLFECGPPEDFKCKFTHHANYSSAILAVNRHLPDLESQIKLTKHEQELAKLSFRKQEMEMEINKKKAEEIKTTPSTTTVTETKVMPVSPTKIISEANKEIKCSRYQFECRTTKECIAIYNACDGIPQCADGSDEASELGCPEIGTTPVATRINPNNPVYEDSSALAQVRKSLVSSPTLLNLNLQTRPVASQQFTNVQPQKVYQSSITQRQPSSFQILNQQRLDADFIRPEGRTAYVAHSPPFDSSHASSYPQIPPQIQNNWISRQSNQMPQQYQQYEDRNSHIFNHKENGLQVSEGQDISQTQYGEINTRENPKLINYLDDIYRQNPQYQQKWAKNNQDDRFNNRNQYAPENNQNPAENWLRQNTVQDDSESVKNYNPPSPQQTVTWKTEKHVDDHLEHEKMAHELKNSKQLMETAEKVSEKKQIKIEKVEKHMTHDLPQYTKVAQYKVADVLDLQDGITETPGGAVLSLTLGIIITCVMALLIGCRLRVVRRRIRRGGKSYAHDADYLVNGMYL